MVALRADLDALPLGDTKDVTYRSTVAGVCHACGHDVHTAVLVGAGLALTHVPGGLPGRVRLIFQPAEELTPGGALDVLAAGCLERVDRIVGLHCDPQLDTGLIGLRVGPLTAAADSVEIRVAGPGGHSARPHLSVDLVDVLGRLATELPAMLSRRVDPRACLSLVWGVVAAGTAANVIPTEGVLRGTLRVVDPEIWEMAPKMIQSLVTTIAQGAGARVEMSYQRGAPPVVNDQATVERVTAGVEATLGASALVESELSMGAEDFAWYLQDRPGVLGRLGVRIAGGPELDLHQGCFDVDERAIAVGVRAFVGTVLAMFQLL
jgi:amidohydrolase